MCASDIGNYERLGRLGFLSETDTLGVSLEKTNDYMAMLF